MIRHKNLISGIIVLVILYFGYVKLFTALEDHDEEFNPLKELEKIEKEEAEKADNFVGDDEETSKRILNALNNFSIEKQDEVESTTSKPTTSASSTEQPIAEKHEERLLQPRKLIQIDQDSQIYDEDLEVMSVDDEEDDDSEISEDTPESDERKTSNGQKPCPDFGSNFTKNLRPKYKLDENRIMSHFVSNGPNNQIVDFRQGLFWAIKLNVSSTLPLFYEHFTISKAVIEPKHRIKLDGSLLSSVSPEEFGRRCKDQEIALLDATPDSANQFQWQKEQRLPQLYDFHGIDKAHVTRFQPVAPSRMIKSDADYVNNWPARIQKYNCSIFAHPYRSKFIEKSEKDEDLWNEIIRATPRPEYIQKMAEEFIEEEMSTRFLAIHWRERVEISEFISKNKLS